MVKDRPGSTSSQGSAASGIDHEHREIRTLLARLRSTRDPNLLLPLLETLQNTLVRHFEHEEQDDGLRTIVSETAPHYLNRVDQLVNEHQEFIQILNDLIERVRACINGPLAAIVSEVEALDGRLAHHDAAESEILSEALLRDLGSGG